MRHRVLSALNHAFALADFELNRCPRELRRNPQARLEVGVRHAICDAILQSASVGRTFEFMQIGAHEAEGDAEPTMLSASFRRRGVLVEPQPRLASQLRRRFDSDPGISIIECAVGHASGSASLFVVDDPDHALPPWLSQVASFDRAHVEKFVAQVPSLGNHIRELRVRVEPPEAICQQAAVNQLDLLLVDVEGWDHHVIKLFPFDRVPVGLVVFEHAHLCRADRRAAVRRLLDLGYRVQVLGRDVIAAKS